MAISEFLDANQEQSRGYGGGSCPAYRKLHAGTCLQQQDMHVRTSFNQPPSPFSVWRATLVFDEMLVGLQDIASLNVAVHVDSSMHTTPELPGKQLMIPTILHGVRMSYASSRLLCLQ